MTQLSTSRFNHARDFIMTHARELEQALFKFHFVNGEMNSVLEALAAYQNIDGGYGQGLEPDCNDTESSVLDTTIALEIFRQLKTESPDEQLRKAVKFIVEQFNSEKRVWAIRAVASPGRICAPWWKAESVDVLCDMFGGCLANPRAAVVGYLHDHQDLIPSKGDFTQHMLEALTQEVVEHLDHLTQPLNHHDLLCYSSMLMSCGLCDEIKTSLVEKLAPSIEATVERDPEKWSGYAMRPLELITCPNHPLAKYVDQSLIMKQFAYEIEQQGENGAWSPNWAWAEIHPDGWAQAKTAWEGVLTLQKLILFDHFGLRCES